MLNLFNIVLLRSIGILAVLPFFIYLLVDFPLRMTGSEVVNASIHTHYPVKLQNILALLPWQRL